MAAALPHLEQGLGGAADRDGSFLLGRALLASGRPADAVPKLQASLQATGSTPDAEISLALGAALFGMGADVRLTSLLRRSGPVLAVAAVSTLFVAGVSLVTNYRDEFNQQVQAGGVDGLIKALAAKNASGVK